MCRLKPSSIEVSLFISGLLSTRHRTAYLGLDKNTTEILHSFCTLPNTKYYSQLALNDITLVRRCFNNVKTYEKIFQIQDDTYMPGAAGGAIHSSIDGDGYQF